MNSTVVILSFLLPTQHFYRTFCFKIAEQIPHGNFGGASAVSPSSAGVQQQQQLYAGSSAANGNAAAGNNGMGQQIGVQGAPPVGVGMPQVSPWRRLYSFPPASLPR